MVILLMRLFYGVYFIGLWICLYHILSQLFFNKNSQQTQLGLDSFIMAFLWPLALFSKSGRKRLKKFSKEL